MCLGSQLQCVSDWGRATQAMASGACGSGCSDRIRSESRDKEEPGEDKRCQRLVLGAWSASPMPLRAVPPVDLVSQTLGGYERISDSTRNIAECREEEHFRSASRA